MLFKGHISGHVFLNLTFTELWKAHILRLVVGLQQETVEWSIARPAGASALLSLKQHFVSPARA